MRQKSNKLYGILLIIAGIFGLFIPLMPGIILIIAGAAILKKDKK